ncbi:MAG: hypothetical protein V1655_01340 [bacterium]
MVKKGFLLVAFVVLLCLAMAVSLPNVAHSEGCDCWIVDYDEYWIDRNNPASGDHAVVWFKCNKTNKNPIVTTDWPWSGYKRNWMVWDKNTNHPMVFVNGSYYWPLKTIGWKEWEIFYTVHLK